MSSILFPTLVLVFVGLELLLQTLLSRPARELHGTHDYSDWQDIVYMFGIIANKWLGAFLVLYAVSHGANPYATVAALGLILAAGAVWLMGFLFTDEWDMRSPVRTATIYVSMKSERLRNPHDGQQTPRWFNYAERPIEILTGVVVSAYLFSYVLTQPGMLRAMMISLAMVAIIGELLQQRLSNIPYKMHTSPVEKLYLPGRMLRELYMYGWLAIYAVVGAVAAYFLVNSPLLVYDWLAIIIAVIRIAWWVITVHFTAWFTTSGLGVIPERAYIYITQRYEW